MSETISLPNTTIDRTTNFQVAIVVIKPEEVIRGKAFAILQRIEEYCKANELTVEAHEKILDRPTLERHYLGKGEEDFLRMCAKLGRMLTEYNIQDYDNIEEKCLRFMYAHIDAYVGRTVIVLKISGEDAIAKINKIKGNTDSTSAPKNTIRGEFSPRIPMHRFLRGDMSPVQNVIHCSETEAEAKFDLMTFLCE